MGVDIGAYRRFRRDEQKRKPGSCAPEGEEKRADAFELNAASCAVLGYVCLRVHAVIIPGKRHFGFKRAQWPPLNRGLRGEGGRCADKEKASPWGRGRRRMRLRGPRMQEALERGGEGEGPRNCWERPAEAEGACSSRRGLAYRLAT